MRADAVRLQCTQFHGRRPAKAYIRMLVRCPPTWRLATVAKEVGQLIGFVQRVYRGCRKKLTFYGRTTPTATGTLRLRLRAYDAYGYGRATLTDTGVLGLRLWAYYAYGYGRATSVLWACGRV